jgi:hypothetical protein
MPIPLLGREMAIRCFAWCGGETHSRSTHVTAKVYSQMLDGRDREAVKLWDSMQVGTSQRHHAAKSADRSNLEQNELSARIQHRL